MASRFVRTAAVLVALTLPAISQERNALEEYRETAGKLIGAAMVDNAGWAKLSYLCDRIGNRLSGSASLDRAIQWGAEQMKKDGLENVLTPPVDVPRWVRGRESAALESPITRSLTMLGLGGSIATPPGGITAEVVTVTSFDDLEKKGRAAVQGKIVLYNEANMGYGRTVIYRTSGASRASKLGAVAALVKSVDTATTLQTVHTGNMNYAPDAPKIPTAAVTVEDALLIQRLYDSGEKVRVHLEMEAQTLPNARAANVIGEIRGREKPDEVVVMGGHIDSWDVGQGAQDDGSGMIAALEAAHLIHQLGLRPRRTIRVVFWVNEENGGAGGRAYRQWSGDVKKHVAAIEMDGGAEKPVGFGLTTQTGNPDAALEAMQQIGKLLEGIGAGQMTKGGGGSDIQPLMMEGVPGLGLRTVGTHYSDWHHTTSDTLDKVDPQDFRLCIATMAVASYILADMPGRLGE
ncbi:MAG: M20/M25/M40 family metallo-hydrolase [Bryobacteraceae bacterium]